MRINIRWRNIWTRSFHSSNWPSCHISEIYSTHRLSHNSTNWVYACHVLPVHVHRVCKNAEASVEQMPHLPSTHRGAHRDQDKQWQFMRNPSLLPGLNRLGTFVFRLAGLLLLFSHSVHSHEIIYIHMYTFAADCCNLLSVQCTDSIIKVHKC